MPKASALARVERKMRSLDKWMPKPVPKGQDFSVYADDPVGFFRDVLRLEHITDEQVAIALSVRDNPETNVQASHGCGKCGAWDAILYLASGKEVRYGEMLGKGNFLINTLDAQGNVVQATARAFDNGIKGLWKVTTETGKEIIRTGNHPIWSAIKFGADGCHPLIQKNGWNSIEQLKEWTDTPPAVEYHEFNAHKNTKDNRERSVKLLCAIAAEVPVFGEKILPQEELTVLAYLIGDGGFTASNIIWTQLPNAQLDDMRACVEAMGCDLNLLKGPRAIGYSIAGKKHGKNHVRSMLNKHGLMGKGSATKFVPDEVMECTRPLVAHFLNRLFSTDGWACKRIAKSRIPVGAEVGYSSNSEKLIRQIQSLLLRFGIHGNLSYRPKVKNWQIFIHRTDSILKFADEIGMVGAKGVALEDVAKICKAKEGAKQIPKWRTYKAHPGTIWEEIRKIEYMGEGSTVGIEVDRYHTYLTDFFEHNSFISACVVLWWVFAVGGLAITTAPTESQVKQILWSEIRKLYQRHKAEFGGQCDILQLKLTESARAYGFTARNYDSNSFQGKHAEKMLLVQDEACGITQEIDDGFESCLTGSSNRGLRIGNPIDPQTPFEKACKRSHLRIPAWNHPNVSWAYRLDSDGIHRLPPEIKIDICDETGAVKPQTEWPPEYPRDVIPGAVSVGWIEKARLRGENSAFWLSRVEGLFPVDSGASIVPQSWFLAARARYDSDPAYWDEVAAKQAWRHGLDVGDGADDSAIASWRGPVLYAVECEPTRGDRLDTARAATLGRKRLEKNPGWCAVDQVGVGAGTLTMLLEQGLQAFGINWGHGAEEKDEFLNEKAESFWALREAFRIEDVAIAPLGQYEDMVMEDLSGIWYEETSAGKVRIEDKAKTRKRLNRSPNAGDAVCLGFGHTPIIEFSSSGKKRVADTIDDYFNL